MGSTLLIEYSNDEEVEYYLNASFYQKAKDGHPKTLYDENDNITGEASMTETYKYKCLQMGLKGALAGDLSDARFNFFAGAGGVLGFVRAQYKYDIPGDNGEKEN